MNANECYEVLEKANWFEGWSSSARESARKSIEENEQFRLSGKFPGAAMVSVWGDSECINGEDSYSQVLAEFRKNSHGFFEPTNVEEIWTDLGDGEYRIQISFQCFGKSYASEIAYEGDWIDPNLFGLVNEAMSDHLPPMRFLMPNVGFGQEFGFLLIAEELIVSAFEMELLPPLDEEETIENADDDDLDEPNAISELYELMIGMDSLEMFEEIWGRLPEHTVYFLQRDLDKFLEAVDSGADINASSSNGILTPLRIAVKEDFPEGLDFLLTRRDLNLDEADPEGDTALSWAIVYGYNDKARKLIEAGANLHFVNNEKKSLVDLAKDHGNHEMVEFLQAKGVR